MLLGMSRAQQGLPRQLYHFDQQGLAGVDHFLERDAARGVLLSRRTAREQPAFAT